MELQQAQLQINPDTRWNASRHIDSKLRLTLPDRGALSCGVVARFVIVKAVVSGTVLTFFLKPVTVHTHDAVPAGVDGCLSRARALK